MHYENHKLFLSAMQSCVDGLVNSLADCNIEAGELQAIVGDCQDLTEAEMAECDNNDSCTQSAFKLMGALQKCVDDPDSDLDAAAVQALFSGNRDIRK